MTPNDPRTREMIRRIGRIATMSAVVLLSACNLIFPTNDRVCTAAGCASGLTVHLPSKPTGAYKVELSTRGFDQQEPTYVYDCNGSPNCQQDIFFSNFVADRVYVRVTTTAGVRVTEIYNFTYTKSRPNGPNCDPECKQATVTAPLPATSSEL